MNNSNEILEKAKWGKLSSEEIKLLGSALSASNEPDLYTVIHAIGKAELTQYQDKLEEFLDYPKDPFVSVITIKVLCGFWGLTEKHIDVVLKFLKGVDWDEDEDVRLESLNIIGQYLFKKKTPHVYKLVLDIFEDESNFNAIRSAAYSALGKSIGKTWEELPPASKPMNFDTDVDFSIINQVKVIAASI